MSDTETHFYINRPYLLGVRHGQMTFVGPFDLESQATNWLVHHSVLGDIFLGATVSVATPFQDCFVNPQSGGPGLAVRGFYCVERNIVDASYKLIGPFLHMQEAQHHISYRITMRRYSTHYFLTYLQTPRRQPIVIAPD